MPKATVQVVDNFRHPVVGASLIPSPIRPFGTNVTDEQGRVNIYKINSEMSEFLIQARGFQSQAIPFPGKGKSLVVELKRL